MREGERVIVQKGPHLGRIGMVVGSKFFDKAGELVFVYFENTETHSFSPCELEIIKQV